MRNKVVNKILTRDLPKIYTKTIDEEWHWYLMFFARFVGSGPASNLNVIGMMIHANLGWDSIRI